MKKIWLVDSDAVFMQGMNIALTQLDVETTLFSNPFAFLRALATGEHPDMIILNSRLAGVNTRDILRVLSTHPDYVAIPRVIVVDKFYSEELHNQLSLAGAMDVLRRDMSASEFNERIESSLNERAPWTLPESASSSLAAISGMWTYVA